MISKLAVTDLIPFIVITHIPFPEHAPDQPVKVESDAGPAITVTTVPLNNEFVPMQLEGTLGPVQNVNGPLPVPDVVTVNEKVGAKLALKESSLIILNEHVLDIVEHGIEFPDHFSKSEDGEAVTVTRFFSTTLPIQFAGTPVPEQEIEPLPEVSMFKLCDRKLLDNPFAIFSELS